MKRLPMFTYTSAAGNEEHIALHRVIGLKDALWRGVFVLVDYGDGIEREIGTSEGFGALQERYERLKVAAGSAE